MPRSRSVQFLASAAVICGCATSASDRSPDRSSPSGSVAELRRGLVGDTFDLVTIGSHHLAALPPDLSCTGSDEIPQSERMILRSDSVVVFQHVERAPCRGKLFSPGDTLIEVTGVYDLQGDTLSFYTVGGQEFARDLRLSGRLSADSLLPFAVDASSARTYARRPRHGPHSKKGSP